MRLGAHTQRVRRDRYVKLSIANLFEGEKEKVYFSWIYRGNGIPANAIVLVIRAPTKMILSFKDSQKSWCEMDRSLCTKENSFQVSTDIRLQKISEDEQDRVEDVLCFDLVKTTNTEVKVIGTITISVTLMCTKCESTTIAGLVKRCGNQPEADNVSSPNSDAVSVEVHSDDEAIQQHPQLPQIPQPQLQFTPANYYSTGMHFQPQWVDQFQNTPYGLMPDIPMLPNVHPMVLQYQMMMHQHSQRMQQQAMFLKREKEDSSPLITKKRKVEGGFHLLDEQQTPLAKPFMTHPPQISFFDIMNLPE